MKALKIIAIVLFLLILGFFGVQAWLGNKIAALIEQKGSEMDGGIYTVTVDKSSVNLFGRSASLKGLKLIPDRETLEGEGRPDMIYEVSIDGVYVSGLNLKLLRQGSGGKLRSVEIDRPLITADVYKPREKKADIPDDTTRPDKPFDIPVRRVIVRDGNIIYREHENGSASYTEADGISADITLNAIADSLTVREMAGGRLSLRSILMTNADGSVDTKVDTVSFDSDKGELRIAAVDVVPKYPKQQFVYKSARHRDWTTLRARDIVITGLDALLAGEVPLINADSVHIGYGFVDSYKDRNANQPYWYKKLFYESIQQLPFLLRTGKIVVASMDADYSELPQFGTEPGVIKFTGLTGTFDSLTNIPTPGKTYYTLSARAMMYGTAPLHATFYFPIEKSHDRFEVKGALGKMNMTILNRMIVPLAKAEIEEGTIDGIDFHLQGNTSGASATLTLLYHDLKIALVKLKGDNEVKERRLISWIANEFVVKESNPRRDGQTVTATGSAERDPNRSQFNLLWKTLMDGIKETAM